MYRSSASGTPREKFLDQFEWDGGDWLYRFKMTGAAYRVTDAEKDAFVATFDRQQRWSFWIGLPFLLAIVFGSIWVVNTATPGSFLAAIKPFVVGSGAALGVSFRSVIDHFAFRAPLRALAPRTPVAPGLSKMARRRLALDRIPPEPLFGAAIICALLLGIFLTEGGLTNRVGQVWIVLFVAFLLWVAIIGFRKWRLARADAAVMSPTI
jgi:hypothetical protein